MPEAARGIPGNSRQMGQAEKSRVARLDTTALGDVGLKLLRDIKPS